MPYHWSPSTLMFYPDELQSAYAANGAWPSDAVPITDAQFTAFAGPIPAGKQRGAVDGAPGWVPAVPTVEQAQAALRAALMQHELAGVYFTPTGASAPLLFPTDDAARAKYGGIWSAMTAGFWSGGVILASDGTPVTLTPEDAAALIRKVMQYLTDCGNTYAALHASVATHPETDITQGWPGQ